MFAYVDIGVIVDHVEYVIMFAYVDIGVIVDHVEYVIMFVYDIQHGQQLHQYQHKQILLHIHHIHYEKKVLTLMVKNYTNMVNM
jgi:hypothetical protein